MTAQQTRLHINRPGRCYYVARVHRKGARRYERVSRHRTAEAAIEAMARAFARVGGYPEINRADVLAVEKQPSYYEPRLVCELRR